MARARSGQEHHRPLPFFQEKQWFTKEVPLRVCMTLADFQGLFWAGLSDLTDAFWKRDFVMLETGLASVCLFLSVFSFRWHSLLSLNLLEAGVQCPKRDEHGVARGPPCTLTHTSGGTHTPRGDPAVWFENTQSNPDTSFTSGN